MNPFYILESINHKPFVLKKYKAFISNCKLVNEKFGFENGYYEKHHIIPSSIDPRFEKLKSNPWNRVDLSPRQHFIAHIILSNLFLEPENRYSMLTAIIHMMNSSNKKYNSKLYSNFRIEFSKRTSERISISNKDRTWINKDGDRKYIKPNELISYLDSGWSLGMDIDRSGNKNSMYGKERKGSFSKESLDKMSKSMLGKNTCMVSCNGIIYNSVSEAQDSNPGISVRKRLDSNKYPEFFRINPKTLRPRK